MLHPCSWTDAGQVLGGLFLLQNWQLCCGKVYLLERLGAGDVDSTSTVAVTNVVLLTTLWLDPTNMGYGI
jgi:hypothetical protein